ncbi:MAG: GatB/YqeY domain-containing protein [Candidatus Omnitrophica bacterium]|nr:GatB/YqeY domain-containing protein [Candidatus Omnitrophota bacterium]
MGQMALHERIENDMKSAMKEGDTVKLSVLRMLVAAIKQFEIDKNIKSPSDADTAQIISKQIKQHRESIEQFKKGNRSDLAEKEASELKILETYMPAQLGEAELLDIVKNVISETGATTKADMGKVMKAVMEKIRGQADGKIINQIVMRLLK